LKFLSKNAPITIDIIVQINVKPPPRMPIKNALVAISKKINTKKYIIKCL
jgi:hypothetical protein